IVVTGDWTDYAVLSTDTNWSKYFNNSGLIKDKVDSFIRDKSVSLLGDYTGSLIPYFKDSAGNNVFIETLINVETDITGLFCTYDIDAVETDKPTGVVDIIGHSLVYDVQTDDEGAELASEKTAINFMSYNDSIVEAI